MSHLLDGDGKVTDDGRCWPHPPSDDREKADRCDVVRWLYTYGYTIGRWLYTYLCKCL